MMRGFIVVINATMAMIFLKTKLYFHHFISIIIITLSVASVGYVGILISKKSI
jgi:hypothetical protein